MRVVIADDAILVREGIARLLADAGVDVVGQAADAEALLACVRDELPDVAIVDIRMPPSHTDEGLRAAREIRVRFAGTGVLVLSQYLEPAYALRLIEDLPEGIGYLLKERVGRVEELVDALQRVAAGECVIDRAVVRDLIGERRADPVAQLTRREREILGLMAEGRSNQGICRELWLSPKTVETHCRSVFAKLGMEGAPRTIAACWRCSPTSAMARDRRRAPARRASAPCSTSSASAAVGYGPGARSAARLVDRHGCLSWAHLHLADEPCDRQPDADRAARDLRAPLLVEVHGLVRRAARSARRGGSARGGLVGGRAPAGRRSSARP